VGDSTPFIQNISFLRFTCSLTAFSINSNRCLIWNRFGWRPETCSGLKIAIVDTSHAMVDVPWCSRTSCRLIKAWQRVAAFVCWDRNRISADERTPVTLRRFVSWLSSCLARSDTLKTRRDWDVTYCSPSD